MLTQLADCPICQGEGANPCHDCDGTGYSKHGHSPDDYGPHTRCQACKGLCVHVCEECKGSGFIEEPVFPQESLDASEVY